MIKADLLKSASNAAILLAWVVSGEAHAQEASSPVSSSATEPAAPVAETQAQAGADQQAQSDTDKNALGDIVVFAERRSAGAALQKVPMAITAVDSAMMEAAQTVDLRDIGRLVPNAQLEGSGTYPGYANFFIRGVGTTSTVRSIDPAINVIQDGMVLAYQGGAVLDTFDLEGIEVLRGPQGVLFGRNASGGAVVLRSKRPTSKFEARAEVTLGNGDTFNTNTSIGGEIVPDFLNARISLSTRHNNGYFQNTTEGTFVRVPSNPNLTGVQIDHPTGGAPKTREIVVKPTLGFTFGPNTHFTLFTQYQNYRDGGGISYAYIPKEGTLLPLQTQWGYTPPTGRYKLNQGTQGYTNIEAYHFIGELVQNMGESDSLTVTAAYRHITYDSTLNVGGDPFDLSIFPDGRERNKQTSIEAKYNARLSDSFELLLGGFYLNADTGVNEYRISRSPTSTNNTYFVNIWDQQVKSFAFFGNIDFKPTDQLTISAGLRYSNDHKDIEIIPLLTCTGQNFTGCPTTFSNAKAKWDNFSPRVVVNYQPSNDLTFYASYSQGYRAGNFNARATSRNAAVVPADPETITAYEIGAKTQFFDRHLRFNITGFWEDYKDIQRIVTGVALGQVTQSLFNAAAATIKGVEVEASVLPFEGFRLDGTLGYTDANYKSFEGLTGLAPGVSPTDLDFDRAAKWSAHIEGSYTRDVGPGTLSMRVAYTYRSKAFMDVPNTPELVQPGFGLIDAGINYEIDHFKVSVFGRNIGNTYYADNRSRAAAWQAYGGSPRTYGVEFGYKW